MWWRSITDRPCARIAPSRDSYVPCTAKATPFASSARSAGPTSLPTSDIEWPCAARTSSAPSSRWRSSKRCLSFSMITSRISSRVYSRSSTRGGSSAAAASAALALTLATTSSSITQPSRVMGTLYSLALCRSSLLISFERATSCRSPLSPSSGGSSGSAARVADVSRVLENSSRILLRQSLPLTRDWTTDAAPFVSGVDGRSRINCAADDGSELPSRLCATARINDRSSSGCCRAACRRASARTVSIASISPRDQRCSTSPASSSSSCEATGRSASPICASRR